MIEIFIQVVAVLQVVYYSKSRHPCNSQTTLKTIVLLYKLFQYNCLRLIELTTPLVLVLAQHFYLVFIRQVCSLLYLLYIFAIFQAATISGTWFVGSLVLPLHRSNVRS